MDEIAEPAQPVDAQPVDAQPVDAQPVDAQPVDAQPVEAQPVEAQPVEPAARVTAIDHVQLAMPVGREGDAEAFYCGVLGFEVLEKPPVLAARGGRWFVSDRTGSGVQVHLGVEKDFRPARKAHPGLRVAGFDALIADLEERGISWRPDDDLPGVRRVYVDDPFGNRLELIDAGPEG